MYKPYVWRSNNSDCSQEPERDCPLSDADTRKQDGKEMPEKKTPPYLLVIVEGNCLHGWVLGAYHLFCSRLTRVIGSMRVRRGRGIPWFLLPETAPYRVFTGGQGQAGSVRW